MFPDAKIIFNISENRKNVTRDLTAEGQTGAGGGAADNQKRYAGRKMGAEVGYVGHEDWVKR